MAQPARKLYDQTAPVIQQEQKQRADLRAREMQPGNRLRRERIFSNAVVGIVAIFVLLIGGAICFCVYAGHQVDQATIECANAKREFDTVSEEYKACKNKLDSLTTNEKLRLMAEGFDMVAITDANSHAAGFTSPEEAKAILAKKAKKQSSKKKTATDTGDTSGSTAGDSGN